MKNTRLLPLSILAAAVILVGCAQASSQHPLGGDRQSTIASSQLAQAASGALTISIRWPRQLSRQTQAIPGSAKQVAAIVWSDASKQNAISYQVLQHSAGSDYQDSSGKYVTNTVVYLPPGQGYVLELRAYGSTSIPGPSAFSFPIASASLLCDPAASPSAAACVPSDSVIASGVSSPFAISAGYATPVHVMLTVPNAPRVSGLFPQYASSKGGSVEIRGQGFGSDPSLIRVLVAFGSADSPSGTMDLGNPTAASDSAVTVRLPAGIRSGTLALYRDGIEAGSTSGNAHLTVLNKLWINSQNFRMFDPNNPSSKQCLTCWNPNWHAAVVAGATATLDVRGIDDSNSNWGSAGQWNVPSNAVAISPTVVTATNAQGATISANPDGTLVFPTTGNWTLSNAMGVDLSGSVQSVDVGTYQQSGTLTFESCSNCNNNSVTALVPKGVEQFFQWDSHVAAQAYPEIPSAAIKATINNVDTLVGLDASDFQWTTDPPNLLNWSSDHFTSASGRYAPVKVTGTCRFDPRQSFAAVLPSGIKSIKSTPSEVYLSQVVAGQTSADNPVISQPTQQVAVTVANDLVTYYRSSAASNCNYCIKNTDLTWTSQDSSRFTIDAFGVFQTVANASLGDATATVALNVAPDASTSIPVHLTNNSGLFLGLE